MNPGPRLVTIVPCMGKHRATRECLHSLLKQAQVQQQIIVVENETWENGKNLSGLFPSVRFIRNPRNEGFTGAVNRGFKEGEALDPDFYFIVNNDAVLDPDCLARLAETLQKNPKAGMAGPKILQFVSLSGLTPSTIWAAGGELFFWKFMARNRGQGQADSPVYDEPSPMDFLSGCALLLRKELVRDLGGLDEAYFTYAEDVDLCLKARAAGWELIYEPRARAIHEGSQTAGDQYGPFQSFYRWRNRLLLARKHGGLFHRAFFLFLFFPVLAARDVLTYLRGGKAASLPFLFKGLLQREPLRTTKRKRLVNGYLLSNPALLAVLAAADFLGRIFFSLIPAGKLPAEVKKILIAKPDHLGDVLLALHVLPALKKAFPGSEIDFLCGSWSRRILDGNPLIRKTVCLDDFRLSRGKPLPQRLSRFFSDCLRAVRDLRSETYDLAIDLRAYYPNLIPLFPFLKARFTLGYSTGGFGFLLDSAPAWEEGRHETEHLFHLLASVIKDPQREPLDLSYLTNEEEARSALAASGSPPSLPLAVLHPFCQSSSLRDQKHWKTGEWRKIIRHLEERGVSVVCSGDAQDRPLIEDLISGSGAKNLAGRTSIAGLAGLIRLSQFTVCVDTFFAHLSGALGALTFEVFNDVEPLEQWKAWGSSVKTYPIESEAEDILPAIDDCINAVGARHASPVRV